MRKYKDLYQYNGKWYTKEQRVAKVGEKVLIVNKWVGSPYKNGDVLDVIGYFESLPNCARYGNNLGEYLYQQEYHVLVPLINGMEITDTWYDETTCMEQPKYEVLYGGIGSKKQPVPFSKEYYGRGNGKSKKSTDKACPFCGHSVDIYKNGLDKWTADCSNCDCVRSEICESEEEARKYWNDRQSPVHFVPEKRKWTEAEIQEARRTVLSYNLDTKYMCTSDPMIVGAYYFNTKTKHYQCATATCMKNDTFDYWIGRMVACLKVHDKQLPEWIKGG